MPTYEYECSKCGAVFEVFQKITDRPLSKCQECGARGTVQRLVSPGAGLIFKGSGFYVTDYKRAGASESAEGEKKSETAEKPAKKKDKSEAPASKKSSVEKP